MTPQYSAVCVYACYKPGLFLLGIYIPPFFISVN